MSMHGNWQKNDFLGKMIRSLKLSKRIFLGASTHGILTHSGFRKYIWFGWPNLRFEVMTCISVKHIYMKWEIQCKKLKQLKVRSYAKNQIKLESIFYSFQSNQTRNEKVLFLTASNSALNTRYPPLPYIFWTLWTWGFTRYHLMYTTPIQKIEEIAMMLLFFGLFLVISEVGSPDYTAKSAMFKIWVFWVISMH